MFCLTQCLFGYHTVKVHTYFRLCFIAKYLFLFWHDNCYTPSQLVRDRLDVYVCVCVLFSLEWRHNERDGVSNRRCLECLLKRLFRRRSKKTSSSASLSFVRGIHWGPINSPHKGPVTRKMFPFDDVIMLALNITFDNWLTYKCVSAIWDYYFLLTVPMYVAITFYLLWKLSCLIV